MRFYAGVEIKNVAGTQSPDSIVDLNDAQKKGWQIPLENFESSMMIHFEIEAESEKEARAQIEALCEQFLVNSVYQFAEIQLHEIS